MNELRAAGTVHWHRGAHERRLGLRSVAVQHRLRRRIARRRARSSTRCGRSRTRRRSSIRSHGGRCASSLVEAGLRAEHLGGRDWSGLSPRMSAKYFVTPDLALSVGGGRLRAVDALAQPRGHPGARVRLLGGERRVRRGLAREAPRARRGAVARAVAVRARGGMGQAVSPSARAEHGGRSVAFAATSSSTRRAPRTASISSCGSSTWARSAAGCRTPSA